MKLAKPLPAVLDVPWTMKPLDSAESAKVERLPDGRLTCSIVHDVIRDVTPKMIVWWLKNMDGDIELTPGSGKRVARYRAWHPRDHVEVRYAKKADDGSNMGVGSRVHIQECFARNPEWQVNITDDVLRLDEGGFCHLRTVLGGTVEVFRIDYTFERTDQGTLYKNRLIAGTSRPGFRHLVNKLVRPREFSDEMGEAWLLHNVEEVGNLEFFLPKLYDEQHR